MSERDKIIYDFGSNNGDDIPYYLKKSDKTVAVEANPALANQIRLRFSEPIREGRLIVENCVLTVGQEEEVTFYLHKNDHVLSQFPRPDVSELIDFDEIRLPSKNVLDLLKKHGDPFYIKVDLENYDQVILRELFLGGIRPKFISAESHSIEIFSLLVALGNYTSFNLVDGPTIQSVYREHAIMTISGKETYSFPHHSAGPFGEDIKGDWMTADNFFTVLALERLGWKDIHATNDIPPNSETRVYPISYLFKPSYLYTKIRRQAGNALRTRAPSLYKNVKRFRVAPGDP